MRIGVVIPVHNQGKYLDQCLSSMQEPDEHDICIYIIDANSKPGEIRMQFSMYPHKMHRYVENPGVTKPWNQGIRMALADDADVVCIANSDILWGPDTISRCAEEAAKRGAAFPLTVQSGPEPDKFDRMARILAFHPKTGLSPEVVGLYLGGSKARNRQTLMDVLTDPSKRKNEPTGGFAGWCFFLSKDCINKVGCFDEQFVLWYQDTDYHWRMSALGIHPVECRNCLIHHYESRSIVGLPGGFEYRGWRAEDERRWKAKWNQG
jgi:GT2 family glycosyltransferase